MFLLTLVNNRLTTMPAQRYYGWLEISYVPVSIYVIWGHNLSLAVHANNVIHGDLTGVSTTLSLF
jgi:hypothetical protein